MAASSSLEIVFRREGGYDVWHTPKRGSGSRRLGEVYPLADGKGWFILGDATHHAWETPEDAAEELLRQFEDARAGG